MISAPCFCVIFSQTTGMNSINGISIWSDGGVTRSKADYNFVSKTHANWVSLQPFGAIHAKHSGIQFDLDYGWECSDFKSLERNINYLHELGYKVFLKPHLTLLYDTEPGIWEGNLGLQTNEEWERFEKDFFRYITQLAAIAKKHLSLIHI